VSGSSEAVGDREQPGEVQAERIAQQGGVGERKAPAAGFLGTSGKGSAEGPKCNRDKE
jgi:hypothetical protein